MGRWKGGSLTPDASTDQWVTLVQAATWDLRYQALRKQVQETPPSQARHPVDERRPRGVDEGEGSGAGPPRSNPGPSTTEPRQILTAPDHSPRRTFQDTPAQGLDLHLCARGLFPDLQNA